VEFQVQVLEVQASHVPQFDMLEVLPCRFDGVEIRGVGWQRLDMYSTPVDTL
jgi:hypothetical protein